MEKVFVITPAFLETRLDVAAPLESMPSEWFIITAYARPGEVRSFAAEAAADTLLAHALDAAGYTRVRVTGRSLSGDHAEPGYGVSASRERVLELARSFGQAAVFHVLDGELRIVDCDDLSAPEVVAGALAERVRVPVEGLAATERFLRLSPTDPIMRAALLRFLGDYADRERNFDTMLKDADESPYTASDWCRAAAEFQNRLECAARVSPFVTKHGYLHCCSMASEPIPAALRPGLTESFVEMWDRYGYEG